MMFELANRWFGGLGASAPGLRTITKARQKSFHRFFPTEAEATAFKAGRQEDGCVASMRPVYRSTEDRQRHFQRCQVELTHTEAWPLQARPPARR